MSMNKNIKEEKVLCYLCKCYKYSREDESEEDDEICYLGNILNICFECADRTSYIIECFECGEEIEEEDLIYLCDNYKSVKMCVRCRYYHDKEEENLELLEIIKKLNNKINNLEKETNQLKLNSNSCNCLEKQVNDLEIKNTNVSLIPDYFTIYVLSESEEKKQQKIESLRKKINNNIIKSKLINIFNELYLNKDKIKEEREIKINNLRKKMDLNIIKSKTVNILRKLNENNQPVLSLIEKIKKNKETIKFDNIKINESIIKSNRSNMDFFADLYEEKEIKKALSNKDFMLAVNEFHSDRNSTRMNHLCKIIYNLRKNDIIWNSKIVFKHLYSFQNIKDYQIKFLIGEIEKLL